MTHFTPKVALSADFLEAFSKIPRKQQKKVRAFLDKFRADPTSAAINFEHIAGTRDEKVRTVRVDQAWRAVVIQPPRGDVYVLVWVDHHDEAMAWAKRKRFDVNPHTGAFQVWQPEEAEDAGEGQKAAAPAPQPVKLTEVGTDAIPEGRLFTGRTDDELLLLGVPEPLLAAVRALRTSDDLLQLAEYLPDEAQNGLFGLHDGLSFEEALESGGRDREQATKTAEQVDTENFEAAFEQPWSKNRFAIVGSDEDLEAILSASLERWRVFLHPSQRKLVEMNAKGSTRVLGGAGTGKTVVAMHRARHLARALGDGPGRVLFTTFTRNLASDIEQNLKNLCGSEIERIEVMNLNRWATSFLKSQGQRFSVVTRDLWDQLGVDGEHGFPTAFYRDEWTRVVQANDVTTEKEYLQVRRVGRGTRLSRKQRMAVWQVMARYRGLLEKRGKVEHADVIRIARELLEEGQRAVHEYRHVVVDETQDLRLADLKLLRAIVPEGPADLFLVGDAHQRIYGHQASLGSAGINIRGRRSRRLRINYRTTEEIRDWAVALLKGVEVDDLDEGQDTLKGYRSIRTGPKPDVQHFEDAQGEADAIVAQLKAWFSDGIAPEEICIAARHNDPIKTRYKAILDHAGIACVQLSRNAEKVGPGVRLATMHRVKGLEFRCMVLASVQKGEIPQRLPRALFADETARRAHEDAEKSLLFVAATRARDALLVTGYGDRCQWL